MKPYYEDDYAKLYCGHSLDLLAGDLVKPEDFSVIVTDPPYGISYNSGKRARLDRSIVGDDDTGAREWVLSWWRRRIAWIPSDGYEWRPALVFGSWKIKRPEHVHTLLIWDTKGALGMGDLSVPWKPSHQEIYVIGKGFVGHRGSDVLSFAPVQSTARCGRTHPHEKPVALMQELISKCPAGTIFDPFCGTGSTLVAAKSLGRRAVGIEIEEKYCKIAAQRLSQETLELGA